MFKPVILFFGQRLVDEMGRPLEGDPYAVWPDRLHANDAGETLTDAAFRRLPKAERQAYHSVPYANVIDTNGNVVRRVFRGRSDRVETIPDQWYTDIVGNEVSADPTTWPNAIYVHSVTSDEITPAEYEALPEDQQELYRRVAFCCLVTPAGLVQQIYTDQGAAHWEPDDSCQPYFEPPLVSTSPSDLPLPMEAAAHPPAEATPSRTPLADQVKDTAKLQIDIGIPATNP